jgi:hypothetical protein
MLRGVSPKHVIAHDASAACFTAPRMKHGTPGPRRFSFQLSASGFRRFGVSAFGFRRFFSRSLKVQPQQTGEDLLIDLAPNLDRPALGFFNFRGLDDDLAGAA